MMTYKLTDQEQRRVKAEVTRWQQSENADEHANAVVLRAVGGDPVARAVLQGMIFLIVENMRLPANAAAPSREDHRRDVAAATVQRLFADECRRLQGYLQGAAAASKGRFKAWVLTVAVRVALSGRRRRTAWNRYAILEHDPGHRPRVEDMLLLLRALRFIKSLASEDREAFLLRCQGYHWREIADRVGLQSPSTARMKVVRARNALTVMLARRRDDN